MGKRLFLWIGYLIFSFVLAFGTLGGDGSLISVVIAGRAPDEPLLFFLSSFITSVVIVIVYLVIDWRLARGPKRPAATTDGA